MKPDGGPAFPVYDPVKLYYGISLRDYFAGQTLIGITCNDKIGGHTYEQIARMSYEQADALIAEREK